MQKLPADVTVHNHLNGLGCHADAGSQGLLQQDSFHAVSPLPLGRAAMGQPELVTDGTSFELPSHRCFLVPGCPETQLAGVLVSGLMESFCRHTGKPGAGGAQCRLPRILFHMLCKAHLLGLRIPVHLVV